MLLVSASGVLARRDSSICSSTASNSPSCALAIVPRMELLALLVLVSLSLMKACNLQARHAAAWNLRPWLLHYHADLSKQVNGMMKMRALRITEIFKNSKIKEHAIAGFCHHFTATILCPRCVSLPSIQVEGCWGPATC
jgi:hypothetical protein